MKTRYYSFTVILILVSCLSFSIFGQTGDVYLSHYQPKTNGNTIRCNTIIQLEDQRMLFGHTFGVKMYDGVRWLNINTPGSVFAAAYQKQGKVYLGGRGYFGLLEKGEDGLFRFKSLSQNIKNVSNVRQVLIAGSKVYFRSESQIFVLEIKTQTLNSIQKSQNQDFFSSLLSFKNQVFVHTKEQGFYEVKENGLNKISFNNTLRNQSIKTSFEFDSQRIMLGTNEGKLYLFDGKNLQDYKIASQAYISSNVLVNGLSISETTFALGTLSGGCLIVEKKGGKTSQVLNYQTDLPDEEILAMGKDQTGNLWLGHQAGISKANLYLPVKVYSTYAGIEGKISTVFISQNQTYVGTSQGLFYLDKVEENEEILGYIKRNQQVKTTTRTVQIQEQGKETIVGNFINNTFGKSKEPRVNVIQEPISQQTTVTSTNERLIYARQSIPYLYKPLLGINDKVRQILSFDEGLLVAGNLGLYEVINKTAKKIITEQYIHTIVASQQSQNTFYIGSEQGLLLAKREANQWKIQSSKIKNEPVYSIVEVGGSIWVSTESGVHRFELNKNTEPEKQLFYRINNPFGEKILLREFQNQLYAFTSKQKYRFSGLMLSFQSVKSKEKSFKLIGFQEKYTWLKRNGRWENLNQQAQTKRPSTTLLNLFGEIEDIFLDNQNNFWIVSNGQLFKVNHQAKINQNNGFVTFLSHAKDAKTGYLDLRRFNIPYQKNGFKLNFYLSTPFYASEKNTVFQYKLKGLDREWSAWSNNSVLAFNFLPAGDYELTVRSKNILEQVSPIASYTFTISPPFWETWWFYFLQTFVLGAMVLATYYYNRADKDYRISHLLTLVTIITIFEFIFLMIEPSVDEFSGGVPVFKLLMNIILAMSLNPAERYVHQYLKTRKVQLTNQDNLVN